MKRFILAAALLLCCGLTAQAQHGHRFRYSPPQSFYGGYGGYGYSSPYYPYQPYGYGYNYSRLPPVSYGFYQQPLYGGNYLIYPW